MGCGASAAPSQAPPPETEEKQEVVATAPKPRINFKQTAKLLGKLQTFRTKRKRKPSIVALTSDLNVITKVKDRLRKIRQRFKAPPSPVILGIIDAEVTSSAKIVRVFTSSTFKDSVEERNILIEEAYPELKSFCQARGYDFQVVDMRWGVRDQASDDHSTTDLCLKEIDLCQKLSTGPNFLSFVSHRYGAPQLPRQIEADEFEKMINNIDEGASEGKGLLTRWYLRDENRVPVTYILSRISRQIPDFFGRKEDETTVIAKQRWHREKTIMLEQLQDLSQKYLSPSECEKYTISVTEKETAVGLLNIPDPGKHCIWFRRNITDIEDQPPSDLLERYIECKGPDVKWQTAREFLRKLKDEKMPAVLPAENLFTYDITWTEQGVDKNNPEHYKYLKKLTSDLVTRMKEMIEDGIINQSPNKRDVMLVECSQHLSFARKKCNIFYGRKEVLGKVQNFFSNKSRKLLVIHGKSGSGKSSIAAMTVKHARAWMSSKSAAIVVRFLGRTATSSTILSLLQSVVKQIKAVYQQNPYVSQNPKSLMKEFEQSLKLAKAERPLVVILDSLNQLDTENSGHKLEWLTLPMENLPHVKIVLTTLDNDPNGTLGRLKNKYTGSESYISVPELPTTDTEGIVQQYLNERNQKLTDDQMTYFLSHMKSCSIPLYLKLSFDEACKWHSYTPSDELILQSTLEESIKHLFSHVEQKHGKIFVSKALGYLTAARFGLSEPELEDILSCDDVVLNDIYQYWTPPVRRLPPLLFVRLKMDIDEYLVERGVDGTSVLYWYHTQFLDVARDRYCETEAVRRQLHEALAEYFSGKWADKHEKGYTDSSGNEQRADRLVKSQSIILGDTYNLRKINNLPYHWANANHVQELKKECLMDFSFLQAKLSATSIGNVLNDYQMALSTFPDDQAIQFVAKVMQLSQAGLRADPQQLATQLLDRCDKEQHGEIVDMLKDCTCFPGYTLLADKRLLTKADEQIPAVFTHESTITGMDMTVNGRILVTCDENHTIKFWNLKEKNFIKGFSDVVKDISDVHFVANDHCILVEHNKESRLTTLNADGRIQGQIDIDFYFTLGGPGKSLLLTAKGNMFQVFDAEKLTFMKEKRSPKSAPLGFYLTANEHKALIGLGVENKLKMSVIDLKTMVFTQQKELRVRSMRGSDDDDDDDNVSSIHLTRSGRHLVVTTQRDSGFIVYKMPSLKELYLIPGNHDGTRWDFHFGAMGHSLYFLTLAEFSLSSIQTLDVRSGEINTILYTTASRVRIHRGSVLVTGGFDGVVKVWDLTGLKTNTRSVVGKEGFRIENLRQLQDTRYAVSLSSMQKKGEQLLQVYDIVQKKVVRQTVVGKNDKMIECCNDHHVVMETKDNNIKKLKMVDLDTMTVTLVFQGRLNNRISSVHVLHDRNEVVALSQGRRLLKTYDMTSGKTKEILKPPEDIDWAQFTEMVCYTDNKVVASMTSTGIVVFDLMTSSKKCIYASELDISDEDAIAGSWTRISKDAKFIAIRCERKLPAISKDVSVDMTAYLIHIWDVANWKYNGFIFEDPMYYEIISRPDEKTEFFSDFLFLDDLRMATIFDQHKGEVLIWDSDKNECLERVSSSITPDADLYTSDVSPYLLIYNLANLEVWDKSSMKRLASMTTDYDVHFSELTKDGLSVLGCKEVPVEIIHWTLHKGGKPVYDMSKKPILFEGVRTDLTLNLSINDESESDSSDPDIDIDDSSEDDKDSDVDDKEKLAIIDELDDMFCISSKTHLTDDDKWNAIRAKSEESVNDKNDLPLTDDDKKEKMNTDQNYDDSEEDENRRIKNVVKTFKETSANTKREDEYHFIDDNDDDKSMMTNINDDKRKPRPSSSSPVPSLETYDYGNDSETSDF